MIEYGKILDLLDSATVAKRADTHSSDKPAADDDDKHDYSDDYGNDFEDAARDDKPNQTATEPKDTDDNQQDYRPDGEGDDFDQEIDDEEMIGIAENCLIRIAEELLNKKVTIRQLYREDIIDEEIEGEKIELLLPLSFLEGLKRLDITDFSQLEIACLMNVLAKPQLENTILLDELIDIMENLGIQEEPDEGTAKKSEPVDDNETPPPVSEQQPNKAKKKGMDLDSLSDEAKTLLLNFAVYLESESID